MPKLKPSKDFADPTRGPVFSIRFILALVLALVGIAWIAYYYAAVRPGDDGKAGGPSFLADLEGWNYLIGFGLFFLGLLVAAHPSTPLGRGRGGGGGMLGCVRRGRAWGCVVYVLSNAHWVFNDLGQKNLVVGIAFMAVGFAYATRWE